MGVKSVPAFKSAAELNHAIEKFFSSCEGDYLYGTDGEPVIDKSGVPVIVNNHPPTVSALALALGFSSRLDLLNFDGKKSFMTCLERALLRIETFTEERLFDKGGYTGAKFCLINNFKGWNEKSDVDTTSETLEKLDSILRALKEGM